MVLTWTQGDETEVSRLEARYVQRCSLQGNGIAALQRGNGRKFVQPEYSANVLGRSMRVADSAPGVGPAH